MGITATHEAKGDRLKREYIRHPIDIPIHVAPQGRQEGVGVRLNNVSVGGLAFRTKYFIESGHLITILIDAVKPVFEVQALVQWCHQAENDYEIGVKFADSEDAFRMRMVEQVCHIEHYRQQVWREEKRHLSGELAAAEWIQKYAHQFPDLGSLTESQSHEDSR